MTPVLLLVHGWGFDASFWQPMRSALAGVETVAWDLGFRRTPSRPPLPAGRPVIAVGHSFGLLWLLMEQPVVWRALVSINGFSRFAAGDDFPAGVAPRVVDRMISRFGEKPLSVYTDFMTRCGVEDVDPSDLDLPLLADGLKGLRHWDGRSRMAGLGPVTLALAGRSDPIVPPALCEDSFAKAEFAWHDGGHLLPWRAPDWCAEQLRRFCDNLIGIEPALAMPGED
ncbi:alpha/beta hydrolase [Telmatospirillum sp.]|uniref:alpha/beta fold hydrolase n=1 Tax=Telmatospirillum sp. TaxID=2079197 RepID=UPI002849473B|nr:alpha/beta hydrolase [Telmatospirillum sp.]MDR3437245.1 alpha/beta hydrolase [Telmatospirillum sp.]